MQRIVLLYQHIDAINQFIGRFYKQNFLGKDTQHWSWRWIEPKRTTNRTALLSYSLSRIFRIRTGPIHSSTSYGKSVDIQEVGWFPFGSPSITNELVPTLLVIVM